MEAAVEKRQPRETAVERLARKSGEFATAFTRMVMLAMMLTPLLLAAILTVDIPMHAFDWMAGEAVGSRPSNWLTRGGFIMALAPFLVIIFARKYGGDEASRAVTASWGLAAIAVFAELSYLAPSLEDGDLPGVRYTVFFTASAMAAQYMAASIYDVVRGSLRWWRAPLYAALCAYFTYAIIYFPGVYAGSGAPWLNWLIGDFAVKALVALAFLPVYGLLRGSLKPKGGYGGK
ncbi:VUT family protein [Hyphococcus flavus]|uniref:VUT family protein n=1 Tax=Hyphococcus flavus TaxID=1866326 RepID=A0AAF0CH90_9PROT|nr:VUT family protein [Hyphococcus flavus]WDI31632.1 VUT family protein [Hyphococcus flavus]